MRSLALTVVVPTVAGGPVLVECLQSLRRQTRRDFEVVLVDNSGRGAAAEAEALADRVIHNERNAGFGAAVNQGYRLSRAPSLATLNDDATAAPVWVEALLEAIERRGDVGMCASRVMLAGEGRLDAAGMLVAADGSSKQRGHGLPPEAFAVEEEVLLPSGSAALYRSAMLEEIGLFDEDFFLYCEDTDLGLRGQRAGWKCLYVPGAVVEHRYSHSAGRASPLKAYYVERNRLFVAAKNFPAGMLWKAPFAAAARYFWHAALMLRGQGRAAEFRDAGNSALDLIRFVARAHLALIPARRRLRIQRRMIRKKARLSDGEFRRLLRKHSIGAKQVATL
ncbi:MAG: glycosyltransferase family 2 protein [Bryobacteraceae bacterium]|nr:glycosyltransferase family 2 protein [Bryobacteraceae bacterium]